MGMNVVQLHKWDHMFFLLKGDKSNNTSVFSELGLLYIGELLLLLFLSIQLWQCLHKTADEFFVVSVSLKKVIWFNKALLLHVSFL